MFEGFGRQLGTRVAGLGLKVCGQVCISLRAGAIGSEAHG